MRYVALLRGINVGGKSIMKMTELRACVGELGHENVRTFIASGNVLFESRERDAAKLESVLERAIEDHFGFQVRVVVRSRSEVEGVVARIPEPWMGTQALRVTVAFLLRGNDARAIAGSLSPRDGIDQVVAAPSALIWAIRRDALTRTGLRLIGTPVYKQMTLRNLNTTLKLAELLRDA